MFKSIKRLFNKDLTEILPKIKGKYIKNAPLNKLTWLGVGGPAEVLFIPKDEDDLSFFLKNKPYNLPVSIIGGGSNLLIRDGGVPGVVIKLDSPYFRQINVDKTSITCFAGVKNAELKKIMVSNELGGLEFLCTIPGVVAGSIKTNAGCFGKEVKDVIKNVTIIDDEGERAVVPVKDLKLSYRHSLFPDDWIITSITFKSRKTSIQTIEKKLNEYKEYRQKNQLYRMRTAGSTFKNPEGLKAWELIKKSGCSNLSIGGAAVSDKHANFIINTGKATAKDVELLGETIIKKVKEKTSITLEWEIKRLGINK